MRGVAPLPLALHPSRIRRRVLGAMHALALVAVALATVAPWVTAVLVVAIMGSAVVANRREACLQLVLLGDGSLEIQGGDGERVVVQLLAESRRLPGIVLLAWKTEGKTQRRIVWPDSASVEERRRLRVWLGALAERA